jgi:peptide/nickel transport system substrate-binding protein
MIARLSTFCAAAAIAAAMGLGPATANDAETLVVVQEAEPVGLDLMRSSIQTTMNVAFNLHDTLFEPKEDASIGPRLAEKWEKLSDTSWKIHLRKDATFHDGTPITTAAVKFSFNRIRDEKLQSPNRSKLSAFSELKVIDDHTFTISTAEPYAPGLYMLAYYLPILPPDQVEKAGDDAYNVKPVGSGPYKLSRWVRGEEVVLEAYKGYYGPKPAYEKLTFRAIPDESARVASLLTGEADVISGVPMHQRKRVMESEKAYLTNQMGNMPYLGLNTYKPPFNDKRVRQAVNHAINRALINKALFQDKALLAKGAFSPRTFGHDPSLAGYAYDPSKAKALLKEAGLENGVDVKLSYPTYIPQIQEQAEAIVSDLTKVGIRATLEPLERAVMWDNYKSGKQQMYIYWWDDAPEPDRYVYPLLNSKSRDYYYKNTELDALLDKARTVVDRGEREKIYQAADRMIYEDAPWAFLYIIPEVFGVAKDVQYEGRRDGFLDMRAAKPKA